MPLYWNQMTCNFVHRCIGHMTTGPHQRFCYWSFQKWVILGFFGHFWLKMFIFGSYTLVWKPNDLKFGMKVCLVCAHSTSFSLWAYITLNCWILGFFAIYGLKMLSFGSCAYVWKPNGLKFGMKVRTVCSHRALSTPMVYINQKLWNFGFFAIIDQKCTFLLPVSWESQLIWNLVLG